MGFFLFGTTLLLSISPTDVLIPGTFTLIWSVGPRSASSQPGSPSPAAAPPPPGSSWRCSSRSAGSGRGRTTQPPPQRWGRSVRPGDQRWHSGGPAHEDTPEPGIQTHPHKKHSPTHYTPPATQGDTHVPTGLNSPDKLQKCQRHLERINLFKTDLVDLFFFLMSVVPLGCAPSVQLGEQGKLHRSQSLSEALIPSWCAALRPFWSHDLRLCSMDRSDYMTSRCVSVHGSVWSHDLTLCFIKQIVLITWPHVESH